MVDRSYRLRRGAVAGCLVACLAACSATTTAPSAGPPPPSTAPAGEVAAPPLRVLQLNLCNSGIAGCYTGRAPAAAASVIRTERPDLVTLNEVCDDDVVALRQALADTVPGGAVDAAFQPARDARTGDPYRCRDGRPYGIGIVSRWPSGPASPADRGIYPDQDRDDPEQRAWLCLDAAADPAVAVCTTHLAYTKREVAGAQCRYLFGTVVAQRRAREPAPLVVGGDLNLGAGDDPALRSCLPPGSALVDDGGEQHVVATPELVVESSRTIDLHGTTDHPGLLVTLTRRTP